LRQAGGRILLTPRIGSTYYARESLPALLRQYWDYGIAKANVLLRHPGRLRPRHLVPSTLVLALSLVALQPLDRRFGRIAGLAALAYTVANGLATASLIRRHGWKQARLVPVCFAAMHFGAGAGMIAGFVRRLASCVRNRACGPI
jgi:succinoglycan biosynthesis protein ExoA